MNAASRLAALRTVLAEGEPEAMLVTNVSNVRYLTGFDDVFDQDANAACLVSADIARVYTDSRYAEAASCASAGTEWTVIVTNDKIDTRVCADLAEETFASLGFESALSYARYTYFADNSKTRLVALDGSVETLREIKEEAELERIERAAALADRAFDHILGILAAGMTEAEVALELEVFMRREGSEGVAFPSIVASGPNSSRPHATVSDRAIGPGDPVVMDFGARIGGYCSDMTRTVVVGRAAKDFRRAYEAVREANATSTAAVRGGLTGVEIDRVARETLERAELAEHFGHGLGHGVGLDVHELPTLSPRGKGVVPAGSVITIEPGVYIEERFGVRIEDLVVVESDGCRVLSSSTKELIEL